MRLDERNMIVPIFVFIFIRYLIKCWRKSIKQKSDIFKFSDLWSQNRLSWFKS